MTSNLSDIKFFFNQIRVKGQNYPFASLIDSNEIKYFKKFRFNFLVVNCEDIEKNIEAEVKTNFQKILFKLKKIGHNLDYKINSTPTFLNNIHEEHNKIYSKSLSYYFENEIKNNWKNIKSLTKKRFIEGEKISNEEYKQALEYQVELSKKINELFGKYDFIICPSTAGFGLKSIKDEKNDYSLIWTYLGLPSINIPAFISKDGFPFGLQIIARKYHDLNLINFCSDLVSKKLLKNKQLFHN